MRNQFKTQRFRIFENDNDIILSIEKDNFILDIQELLPILNSHTKQDKQSIQEYNVFITFDGCTLAGSKETPNNPLFFGELDKEGEFIESKPIYHLIGEIVSNSTESTNSHNTYSTNNISNTNTTYSHNANSTLNIFLNNSILTILNYSLLVSSLNIKLECKSTESKEIQEREKAQKQKDSSPMAQNDNPQPTAMLHPILEDDEIKCPHNGVVKLKSNKGKPFTSKGIPLVLESDLLHSSIIGCANNIAGVPTPCSSVSVILPSSLGLKKFNDDYPIMQDLVSSGCLTDKGFPLTCTPKENTFRINSPNP
ncbi:hypothetical protein LS78_010095, partial [Helicobacter bilis]